MRKFWRLPRHDRLLLLEATVWLAVAGFAIAMLPFRYVGRLAASRVRGAQPPQQIRATEVKRVGWAIVAAARRVPWHTMCFQQGLAAQFMLRRRGIPSVLHYGAAQDQQQGLSAHVWVARRGRRCGWWRGRFALCRTRDVSNSTPLNLSVLTSILIGVASNVLRSAASEEPRARLTKFLEICRHNLRYVAAASWITGSGSNVFGTEK